MSTMDNKSIVPTDGKILFHLFGNFKSPNMQKDIHNNRIKRSKLTVDKKDFESTEPDHICSLNPSAEWHLCTSDKVMREAKIDDSCNEQTQTKTLYGEKWIGENSEWKIMKDNEENEKKNRPKDLNSKNGPKELDSKHELKELDSKHKLKELDSKHKLKELDNKDSLAVTDETINILGSEKRGIAELQIGEDLFPVYNPLMTCSSVFSQTMDNNTANRQPVRQKCPSKKIYCSRQQLETLRVKKSNLSLAAEMEHRLKNKHNADRLKAQRNLTGTNKLLPIDLQKSKKDAQVKRPHASSRVKRPHASSRVKRPHASSRVKRPHASSRVKRPHASSRSKRCKGTLKTRRPKFKEARRKKRNQIFSNVDFDTVKTAVSHHEGNFLKKNNGKRNSSFYLQLFNKRTTSDSSSGHPLGAAFKPRSRSGGNGSSSGGASGSSHRGNSSRQEGRDRTPLEGTGKGRSQNSGGNGGDDDDDDTKRPGRPPKELQPLPNLPAPILTPEHRRARELAMMNLDPKGRATDKSVALYQDIENAHGALSITQLCDTLGFATHRIPELTEVPNDLNICLTLTLHDLANASSDSTNEANALMACIPCCILSDMLKHLASLVHEPPCLKTCEPCSQIFHLIIWHVLTCIGEGRQRQKSSKCDLCYKISKTCEWRKETLTSTMVKLRAKIKKYCAKVLGTSPDTEEQPRGIPEIDTHLSPEISSSSLNGNLVTQESGYQASSARGLFGDSHFPLSSSPDPYPAVSLSAQSITSSISLPPFQPSQHEHAHSKLARKPSAKGRQSLPQTIEEETADEPSRSFIEEARNDVKQNSQILQEASPYDTQPTYGQNARCLSMPVKADVHDNEQFLSTTSSNRPLGAPGVGIVVYAHPSQLRIVASYWAKKREECEKTGNCPYQHREEGVILAEYRNEFSILRQRYQKKRQWQRLTHLGNGMSGKCHLALDVKTNFRFCCKKIHLLRYCEDELSIWTEIKHYCIVKLYGAIRHGVKVYIFSEFIDGGDLAACIEEQKLLGRRLSHWSALNYFKQLLDVLAYLQSKNILHEDIKADNILLKRNTTYIAVTDFGTSRKLQDPKELKNKQPVGSPTHWSPEKASMEGHGFPSDLWAAVCVLVHMLSGLPPWVKRFNRAGILNYIIYAQPPPMDDVPQNVQAGVRKLIEKGLVKDPVMRPSPGQLLQDPAFQILDDEKPETYYSTLVSHSVRNIPRPLENNEEEQKKVLATTPLNVIPDKTVLYEQHISTVTPDEVGLMEVKSEQGEGQVTALLPAYLRDDESEETTSLHESEEENASGIEEEIPRGKGKPPVETKISELLEPKNIDNLLPYFSLIYPADGSINSLSIQNFFEDNYTNVPTVEVVSTADSLQMYQPHERDPKHLPNLSIFDASISSSSSQVNHEEKFGQAGHSQETEGPRKTSPVVFTFSSGSDCPSSELFETEQGPEIDEELTPTAPATPVTSSAQTNFMMKKKENLKLNVTKQPRLEHSTSETLPQSSSSDYKEGKRSNTWTRMSSQQTPSSGRQGYPSSTSSLYSHAFFDSSKSVIEQQDSEFKHILENLQKEPGMSNHSSDVDDDLKYETQNLNLAHLDSNFVLDEYIDDSTIKGQKLEFFNNQEKKLFEIRVEENPAYLSAIIQTIRLKVAGKHNHYTVRQMDGASIKFSRPLLVLQYVIVPLDRGGDACLCDVCSNVKF